MGPPWWAIGVTMIYMASPLISNKQQQTFVMLYFRHFPWWASYLCLPWWSIQYTNMLSSWKATGVPHDELEASPWWAKGGNHDEKEASSMMKPKHLHDEPNMYFLHELHVSPMMSSIGSLHTELQRSPVATCSVWMKQLTSSMMRQRHPPWPASYILHDQLHTSSMTNYIHTSSMTSYIHPPWPAAYILHDQLHTSSMTSYIHPTW